MREILFRGQRKDTKEWVEGAYYHQTEFYGDICDYHYIITSKGELEDNMMIFDEVIPETVGQFTGLYDSTKWEQLTKKEQSDWLKNHTADEWKGRKIFEGDILKSCEYDDIYFVKYFDDENYSAFDCVPDVPLCECNGLSFLVNTEGCEVIGNIHDNPELLEVGENAE